ncbi:MAG: DNA-binding transcriptional regulator [Mesorhizobium amorphae]|nr:MAG: DNA-binding transcriptional regulator [Mesorhizobium amorphae]
MRRADRLFDIVQHLRGGRLVTARTLSERLEVSERTIYRDIADLQSSGVPIEGEAGVGYVLRAGFELPPLMFTRDEVAALVAGARMVQGFGGAAMARAAAEALVKIGAVLPENQRDRVGRMEIHAFPHAVPDAERLMLDRLDRAADRHEVLEIAYRDEAGRASLRIVRPLGLSFWGKVWTLVAWCELRDDFRVFRVDRITAMESCARFFRPERGRTLLDFFKQMEACDALEAPPTPRLPLRDGP